MEVRECLYFLVGIGVIYFPGLNTKITSFLDPDGWKTVLVDNKDFFKELQP